MSASSPIAGSSQSASSGARAVRRTGSAVVSYKSADLPKSVLQSLLLRSLTALASEVRAAAPSRPCADRWAPPSHIRRCAHPSAAPQRPCRVPIDVRLSVLQVQSTQPTHGCRYCKTLYCPSTVYTCARLPKPGCRSQGRKRRRRAPRSSMPFTPPWVPATMPFATMSQQLEPIAQKTAQGTPFPPAPPRRHWLAGDCQYHARPPSVLATCGGLPGDWRGSSLRCVRTNCASRVDCARPLGAWLLPSYAVGASRGKWP